MHEKGLVLLWGKVALCVFPGVHQEPGLRQPLHHSGLAEGSLTMHGGAVPVPTHLDTGEGGMLS